MKKYILGIGIVIIIIIIIFALIISINREKFNTNSDKVEVMSQTKNKVYYIYTYIDEEIKNNSSIQMISTELENEYTPKFMLNNAEAIALVTIIDLDGASMEYGPFGMTYGKALVNNVIKGNINSGDVIEYIKPGGTISVSQYDKYDAPASVQKRDYLAKKAGIVIDKEHTYINFKFENDIELEAGKTYLVYLNYVRNYDKYEIIGLGNGIREINVPRATKTVTTTSFNIDELQVKNNKTGEWESLNTYVQKNITKLDE